MLFMFSVAQKTEGMSATVTWKYADWRSQKSSTLQLDRLRLHMQEVSGFVLSSQSKGRGLTLDATYLPMLQAELQRLESRISLSSIGARFGVSRLDRGGST